MDLFTKRCGCGRILSLRESCPVCAVRRREELHARGVAAEEVYYQVPSRPVSWTALAGLAREVAAAAACDVPSWAQVPEGSEVAEEAYQRQLAEAREDYQAKLEESRDQYRAMQHRFAKEPVSGCSCSSCRMLGLSGLGAPRVGRWDAGPDSWARLSDAEKDSQVQAAEAFIGYLAGFAEHARESERYTEYGYPTSKFGRGEKGCWPLRRTGCLKL